MTRTIVRLFDRRSDAMEAAHELERMGVRQHDVSIIASNKDSWFGADDKNSKKDLDHDGRDDRSEGAAKGATTGGILGAGAGMLAGLGLLAIPGLGPVVAAGWLASTAAGAAAGAVTGGAVGGIVAALQREGVSEGDAHVYSEGVRRGGTLLTVRAEDARARDVEEALARYNATDVGQRGQEYRSSGWSRFDENQPPA
jgi:hypothetical protein